MAEKISSDGRPKVFSFWFFPSLRGFQIFRLFNCCFRHADDFQITNNQQFQIPRTFFSIDHKSCCVQTSHLSCKTDFIVAWEQVFFKTVMGDGRRSLPNSIYQIVPEWVDGLRVINNQIM